MRRNGRVPARHRWSFLVAVLALALAGVGSIVSTSTRAAADPKAADCARTGAVFNNPHSDERGRIHEHIVCLIDGAPAGSEIQLAGYHFADQSIVDALTAAIKRKVKVKIITERRFVSSSDHPDRAYFKQIQALIGSDKSKDSWAASCAGSGDDGACIGSFKMHNKMLTFSETHGVENVTFITSSNFQHDLIRPQDNSGVFMWNSGYTVADNAGLYDWLARKYFRDLAADGAANPQYFEDHDLPADEDMGDYKVFHTPRKSGNTVLDILNKIKCRVDGSAPTVVRTAVWAFSGEKSTDPGVQIADRLWELDNEGCEVDIVATAIAAGEHGPLRALLRKPTGDGGPEVREFYDAKSFGVHEKNLMIDGWYDGKPDQKVVFTGSVNYTERSAHLNDETWLQINDPAAHDQFVANFGEVRYAAHTCWQSDDPDGCGDDRSMPKPKPPLNCHETADEYAETATIYLYSSTNCAGANGAKDKDADRHYGDGQGEIKDFDNSADSIVNTTDRHLEFYNYPDYNKNHPEGDSFCLRPGQWINKLSLYGDNAATWSNSISSHRPVDAGECDRWFGGYHEPYWDF